MKHYSTIDDLSSKFSFANFYQHRFDKFEKYSEVSFLLNNIRINKQPNDSTIFC